MPGTIENERVESTAHPSYDVRFAAIETRITAMEVDLAVIRTSFATKDDVQRIITLLYEHKLEMSGALAKQREDFQTGLAYQREELQIALAKHREEFQIALYKQREEFQAALAKQREDFQAALAKQREDFHAALAQVQIDLGKTLMSHTWKLYGLASLVLGGVYYIARYVH
jgi:dsDNA-binding SOS-regulon protein